MQLYWVNIPNPNQGTIELPTMKHGGGEIIRTISNKRVVTQPDSQAIMIMWTQPEWMIMWKLQMTKVLLF